MDGNLTSLLRSSDDAFWPSLRSALAAQGVRVEDSHLAFSAEQGDDGEFGVLLTDSDTIFEFSLRPSTGELIEWVNVTDWWQDTPYRDDIEACLRESDGA